MEIDIKLMSLFDGSGGFPLAASLCGIEPVYAAEVEPYPIAVTKNRFPKMKHLGDVSKVKGGEIEPVDIITFGSPCQDMSIAGKRAGLKHADMGDDETTRSGLFLEAIRIIKEMREATRRLTPTECARLQGFPDWWGEIPKKDNLTDDEYVFWLNARNTYAKINNKTTKEYSKEQMLSWYNKLHSDSSEYKMWGNGIALPNALYVMQGIAEVVGVHHSK